MERHNRRGNDTVRIRVGQGEEGLTTLDLYRWLRADRDIREHADMSLGPSHPDNETMGAVEVINLVLGHGFAALNLALAYASWRGQRPSAPSVTIITNNGSITVQGHSEETVRRIVAALEPDARRGPANGS